MREEQDRITFGSGLTISVGGKKIVWGGNKMILGVIHEKNE